MAKRKLRPPPELRTRRAPRLTLSPSLRFLVLQRDNFRCHYCGVPASQAELTPDHVIPVSKGGAELDPSNLVASCHECNTGKMAKTL